ncbi:hypothetical protein GUJ93_ZPchr0013g36100 [Zizania palustris]|uniref:HIT domain-containing protein n=1 Tax=Zizania palustris TaxID=103762 RepID=A0A8J5WWA7_ZIZPA|nr:hypothetical protein GUJ93_ZPchr0013g36100 [Zizania palustris]
MPSWSTRRATKSCKGGSCGTSTQHIHLHLVGVDHLIPAKTQREVDGEAGLPRPRGAHDHHGTTTVFCFTAAEMPSRKRRHHRDGGVEALRERDHRGSVRDLGIAGAAANAMDIGMVLQPTARVRLSDRAVAI